MITGTDFYRALVKLAKSGYKVIPKMGKYLVCRDEEAAALKGINVANLQKEILCTKEQVIRFGTNGVIN